MAHNDGIGSWGFYIHTPETQTFLGTFFHVSGSDEMEGLIKVEMNDSMAGILRGNKKQQKCTYKW